MQTFKILIAENDIASAEEIKKHLTQWGYQVVSIATSRREAEQLYRHEQPDLTLINMHLKSYGAGVELAHFIRRQAQSGPFIYLASALNRQEIELVKPTLPAGFLSKPLQPELLYANVEIALLRYSAQQPAVPVLTLSEGDNHHILPLTNILYLEADHVYVQVYTADGEKILQRRSLTDLLEQLPAGQFVQTHRSFVVNIEQLNRWDKQYVYVRDQAVPLSRGRRKEVLAALEGVMSNV